MQKIGENTSLTSHILATYIALELGNPHRFVHPSADIYAWAHTTLPESGAFARQFSDERDAQGTPVKEISFQTAEWHTLD